MKKNYALFFYLVTMLVLLGMQQLTAQSLLEWNFYTPTASTGKEATFNATRNNSNLETSVLSRGAGAPSAGGSSASFVGNMTVSASLNEAIANNAYYEFKVQVKDGFYVSLKKLKSIIRIQTYSAKTYQWMYSLDGVNFSEAGTSVTVSDFNNNGVVQPDIDLSPYADLQSVSPISCKLIVFRLYAWGGVVPGAEDPNPTYINFGLGKATSTTPALAIEGAVYNKEADLIWNFYGSRGTEASYYPTTIDNNLDFNQSLLTRGAGSPATNGNTNGFSANQAVASNVEDAFTNNNYFELKIKTNEGETVSIDSIDMIIRTQKYASNVYQWFFSKDGGDFVAIGAPVTIPVEEIHSEENPDANNGFAQPTVYLASYSDLQNVPSTSTITFRLYSWGAHSPAPEATDKNYVNFGFGKSSSTTPSFVINTTVTGDAAPSLSLISGWEFSTIGNAESANPSPVAGSFNATTNSEYLQPSTISRGSGLVVAGLFYSYAASSPLSPTKESALTNNLYFEIQVTPLSTHKLNLSGLRYRFRRYAAGPTDYFWQYSTDDINYTEIKSGSFTSVDTNGDFIDPLDFSGITALQDVQTTVKFRLYVWGVTNAAQVFAFGRYASGNTSNSVSIYGDLEDKGPSTSINTISSNNRLDVHVAGRNLNVQVAGEESEEFSLCLHDIYGRTQFVQSGKLNDGINQIVIPMDNFEEGVYIFSILYQNGEKGRVKFMIQ